MTDQTEGTEPRTSLLIQALSEVATEIERVEKRGRNLDQKYDFATAADIFDEIRARMGKRGVVLTPSLPKERIEESNVTSRNQSPGIFVRIYPTYTFRHYSGETLAIEWFASAIDYPGDKAIYKALTSGLKYLLNQTFLISTGADDVESTDHGGGGGAPRPGGRLSAPDADPVLAKRFDDLNSTLAKPWQGALLKAKLDHFGLESCIAQLEDLHRKEHGPDDAHLEIAEEPA